MFNAVLGGVIATEMGIIGLCIYEHETGMMRAAQKEITDYVKQNPSQGHYQCKTKSGQVLSIKAGDFQSGEITVSVEDPVQPNTCKAVLNLGAGQPGGVH
jgi:hypothetical protein